MPGYRNRATGTVAGNTQAVTLEWRETTNGAVGVQVAGSFTGTLTFEATIDGSNWVAVQVTNANSGTAVTTTTTTGLFRGAAVGLSGFRVIGSSWSANSATVTIVGLPNA